MSEVTPGARAQAVVDAITRLDTAWGCCLGDDMGKTLLAQAIQAAVQAERERCAKVAESMIVFSGEQGRLRASIAQAIRQEGEAS